MRSERFRTQPRTPIKEVTIETGQRACDRPNSETVRTVWNPIAVLASIYKVIHSFWQRLLSRWTPHFHDNQQKHPTAEDKVVQPVSRALMEKSTQTANDYSTNDEHKKCNVCTQCCLLPNPYQLLATGLLNNPLCNLWTQSRKALDLMSESDDYD